MNDFAHGRESVDDPCFPAGSPPRRSFLVWLVGLIAGVAGLLAGMPLVSLLWAGKKGGDWVTLGPIDSFRIGDTRFGDAGASVPHRRAIPAKRKAAFSCGATRLAQTAPLGSWCWRTIAHTPAAPWLGSPSRTSSIAPVMAACFMPMAPGLRAGRGAGCFISPGGHAGSNWRFGPSILPPWKLPSPTRPARHDRDGSAPGSIGIPGPLASGRQSPQGQWHDHQPKTRPAAHAGADAASNPLGRGGGAGRLFRAGRTGRAWDGSLTTGLPEGAIPRQRLLHGLTQALPLLLLAAMLCLTVASFRQPGQRRAGALRGAIGLVLLLIVGVAAHQAIFRWIFLPAVASRQFDEAQLVGTRTSLGEPAPDFAVTTIEGQTIQTADLRGKVLLINFFIISSAPCDQQLAQWQDLWNQFHADSRLRMLAIGRGESVEAVRAFAAEKGFAFPLAADPDARGIRSVCLRGGPTGLSDLARGKNRFPIARLPRPPDRAGANAPSGARQAGLKVDRVVTRRGR